MEERVMSSDHEGERTISNRDSFKLPRLLPHETASPVIMSVTIDCQCYPPEKQIARMRSSIQEVALALHTYGNLKPYQIAQSLDAMRYFWERFEAGDIKLKDFECDFTGEKRKARLLTEAASTAKAVDNPVTSGGNNGNKRDPNISDS